MRVAMIGAGGVGGYFGGRLAESGVDTTFLVRGRTLDALRTNGLRVESIRGDFHIQVQATDDPAAIGPVDAVLVTTKAWQVGEAIANIRPMLGPETPVVPLENGVESPEVIAHLLGQPHAVGGLCAIVSFIATPGHIKHVAAEPLVMFGELDNRATPRLGRLRDALLAAGVQTEVPADIHRSMWSKFFFIVPMSAVGAITRVPVGVWRSMPKTRAVAESILGEMIAVARARGIAVDDDAVALTMGRIDGMAPEATTSMQRDLMEGRPSELDAQLGAVVRLGRASGVPTPVTELLYDCLVPQQRQYPETFAATWAQR